MSSVGRRFSIHMTDTTERSGFVYMHKLLKQLMILLLCTVLIGTGFSPASVSAASRPVTISSCKISGKSKVRVTAVTANPRKISGSRCYLFALTPGMSARPVASCKKSKKMTFKKNIFVPYFAIKGDILLSKYFCNSSLLFVLITNKCHT